MNKNTSTSNAVHKCFRAGYDHLPRIHQGPVKNEIMKSLGWSYVTFYNKRKGAVKIRELEMSMIENIFSVYHINPWTGKKTKGHAF
jgi:hypothetical protein